MKSYREMLTEDLRLVTLRILAESNGYGANSSVLQMAVAGFGHDVSRDHMHTQLAWLAEQELVTIEIVATVQVARLTGRGLDVTQGRAVVPGVKRPGPGA